MDRNVSNLAQQIEERMDEIGVAPLTMWTPEMIQQFCDCYVLVVYTDKNYFHPSAGFYPPDHPIGKWFRRHV